MSAPARDGRIARAIEGWFAANARALPWRTEPRNGYAALVSEAMLLQTQAARVAARFPLFLEQFPTVQSLAAAREHEVLALWSGLGYYRRARLLHAAARAVVSDFNGAVPADAAALRTLPGVGRYSAGSIASIAFGAREPIVDGNVSRVLLRIDGRRAEHGSRDAMDWSWDRADALVRAAASPGALNEGLMELGATVCTPRAPRCDACPVARLCVARREGLQEAIPAPKHRAERSALHIGCVRVRDGRGRLLVERRAGAGMWSGLWQPPSVESESAPPRRATVARHAGLDPSVLHRAESFEFLTTHRAVRFVCWRAVASPRAALGRRWLAPAQVAALPLASPHRRILLGEAESGEAPARRTSRRRRIPSATAPGCRRDVSLPST